MKRISTCALCLLAAAVVPAQAQVDLAGSWVKPNHEQHLGDATIGDYTGIPINEAARVKADAWDAARHGVPEHQCEPHPADYGPVGPANMRIWPTVEPKTQEIVAWNFVLHWMVMHRTIWMDGRPHPPEWAPHTWQGFSTGVWEGDMLTVTTTHLKAGWLRRNGLPRSDKAVLREHWFRHGNVLTLISITDDPVYLTEPFIRTLSWEVGLGFTVGPYPCDISYETIQPDGWVPFHLPGANPSLYEVADEHNLPRESIRGGVETTRPEYAEKLKALAAPRPPEVRR